MRAYNEEIEHLNEVARNRPRAQLVLGKERCSSFACSDLVEKLWVRYNFPTMYENLDSFAFRPNSAL